MRMNRKILLSLLIIGLVVSVASAGTWAYFSDVKSTQQNTLKAGKLILTLSTTQINLDDKTDNFITPGEYGSGEITIKNDGDIPGDLYIRVQKNELTDYLIVTTKVSKTPHGNQGVGHGASTTITLTNAYQHIKTLNPDDSISLPISYYMPTTVTGCQGVSANFVFDFVLMQKGSPESAIPI